MLAPIFFTTIGFALGFPAALLWVSGRNADRLSARRVAEIIGLDRSEVARLRRGGVL